MFTLIHKLYRVQLLTLGGILHLLAAILTTGTNLMALLSFAARLHPERLAISDDRERLSYGELWQQIEWLASALQAEYGVRSQQKVALLCRNHAVAIKCIFAFSRLGTHLYLLNPEMSASQFMATQERLRFDFVVYDQQLAHFMTEPAHLKNSLPAYHPSEPSIDRLSSHHNPKSPTVPKAKPGNIVVMTGGTTGQPKAASRKPSVFGFLPPFCALLTNAHLDNHRSLYIATPLCHGYGVAMLLIGVVLAREIYICERFDAAKACSLIATNDIQAVTLVPLMLQRMLKVNPAALSSLGCIISGSALLPPTVAQATIEQLGEKLFNLYGTSEAGFCIIGTPAIISRKTASIGKPILGVRARIVNDSGAVLGKNELGKNEIGQLWIRSSWTSNQQSWIPTGDLAYRDGEDDIFLCGRVDDMIVSGGENVYPVEVENILAQHPEIEAVAVIGIADAEFGQRLKAVAIRKAGATLDPIALQEWLKPRVARYQMPAIIDFRDDLPYTSLDKVDKKALRA